MCRKTSYHHLLLLLAVARFGLNCSVLNAQNCLALASGLVDWWQAEGDMKDVIGGNNGQLGGPVTYGAGKVGSCFEFDGNGDGVLIGNPTSIQCRG